MSNRQSLQAAEISPGEWALLGELQSGLPLVPRPFAEIGSRINLPEAEVLASTRRLLDSDVIREISGIFDPRSLGYESVLVAARAHGETRSETIQAINDHPGVSHNYRREAPGAPWDIWFTFAARGRERMAEGLGALAQSARLVDYRPFPALRVFKIGVRLGSDDESDAEVVDKHTSAWPDAERDRAFVRELQQQIAIVPRPFQAISSRLGVGEADVLDWASSAIRNGWLRRIAAVLRHRKAGFVANGMAVWRVPPDQREQAGKAIAAFRQITHCFERPDYPDWPYSIYATAHARTRAACEETIAGIAEKTGFRDYVVLFSSEEYKKERVRYFLEGANE